MQKKIISCKYIHLGINAFFFIFVFSLSTMEIDKQVMERNHIFNTKEGVFTESRESFYEEEKWVTRFSFLPFSGLSSMVRVLTKINPKTIDIYGKEYVVPSITIGLNEQGELVTVCGIYPEEYLVIRYEKSIKANIGQVTSGLINLRYIPDDQIDSLILWIDDKYKDIPVNQELIIKRLFCCCIENRMSFVHQLEGQEDSLVISFINPDEPIGIVASLGSNNNDNDDDSLVPSTDINLTTEHYNPFDVQNDDDHSSD